MPPLYIYIKNGPRDNMVKAEHSVSCSRWLQPAGPHCFQSQSGLLHFLLWMSGQPRWSVNTTWIHREAVLRWIRWGTEGSRADGSLSLCGQATNLLRLLPVYYCQIKKVFPGWQEASLRTSPGGRRATQWRQVVVARDVAVDREVVVAQRVFVRAGGVAEWTLTLCREGEDGEGNVRTVDVSAVSTSGFAALKAFMLWLTAYFPPQYVQSVDAMFTTCDLGMRLVSLLPTCL